MCLVSANRNASTPLVWPLDQSQAKESEPIREHDGNTIYDSIPNRTLTFTSLSPHFLSLSLTFSNFHLTFSHFLSLSHFFSLLTHFHLTFSHFLSFSLIFSHFHIIFSPFSHFLPHYFILIFPSFSPYFPLKFSPHSPLSLLLLFLPPSSFSILLFPPPPPPPPPRLTITVFSLLVYVFE